MPAVVASGLVKKFGDLTAVDDLSLEVEEGEIFGFLGPNGAGKTTSIRMMTGLLAPTHGEVTIYGERVKPGGGRAKSLTGLCPQEIVVWERLSCVENLVFYAQMHDVPRRDAKERAHDLLARLGLAEKADERAINLSGGMKRRLNVALALVHDPKVVVLDEPEAGLDPQARVVLRDFIDSLRRDRTVIFTTHNMEVAERLVDRVAIIDHGKLIALDTPDALKRRHGQGDVMEIHVQGDAAALAARLTTEGVNATAIDHAINVRGLDLASRFASIIRVVENAGAKIEDITYRGNTLEDVFISLTGRALRE